MTITVKTIVSIITAILTLSLCIMSDIAYADEVNQGFELMKSEKIGALKLGLSEKEVSSICGAPEKKSKDTLWGADGQYHQTWNYPKTGVTLDMVSASPSEKKGIGSVTIAAPCSYATSKGITIGSSGDQVKKAYRKYIGSSVVPTQIVAGSIYGGVIFTLKNGKVVRIFIGAAAE